MNKLMIVLSLALTGCIASIDTSETGSDQYNSVADTLPSVETDGPGYGCHQSTMMHITVRETEFWVSLPVACDPRPYIFKGDPGPDFGQPWDENSGISQEEILQITNLKIKELALESGSFGILR